MSHRNTMLIGVGLFVASLLLQSVQCQEINGKRTFIVGGEKGWNFYPGITDWPKGKKFTPGDVLVFKYQSTNTTYVRRYVANFPGVELCYTRCDPYNCAYDEFMTGNDQLVLQEGWNYFLSSDWDHCMAGQRIKICAEYDGKGKNCTSNA